MCICLAGFPPGFVRCAETLTGVVSRTNETNCSSVRCVLSFRYVDRPRPRRYVRVDLRRVPGEGRQCYVPRKGPGMLLASLWCASPRVVGPTCCRCHFVKPHSIVGTAVLDEGAAVKEAGRVLGLGMQTMYIHYNTLPGAMCPPGRGLRTTMLRVLCSPGVTHEFMHTGTVSGRTRVQRAEAHTVNYTR